VNWALGKVTEVNSLDHAKEEIGDVLSTLYALATTIRCDAHAELDRKMAFNRTRPKSYYDAKTLAKRGALRQLAEEPKP
jgi:NTP pyrophosphatase (non-canonical NTP hydrolase)